MKFYNTCFVLIIAVFNIFPNVSGKVPNVSGTKFEMNLDGPFTIYDENKNYYISVYVELPSGNSKNYLLWLTFATGDKIKNGIKSEEDKETAVFPFDWKYNEEDKEGKIEYQNGHIIGCILKAEFNTDEYKQLYHTKNAMRTFTVFASDVLKDYADKVTDNCFSMTFRYKKLEGK